MHSEAEQKRLDQIQALVAQIALLLETGEQLELWNSNGTTYCKVGFEDTSEVPVRCIAEVAYMLGAVKAIHRGELNKSGLISDSDYFV